MGIGYDMVQGLKKSFSNEPRREEKFQRTYTISQEEAQARLRLKGKMVYVFFDKKEKTIKIITEGDK